MAPMLGFAVAGLIAVGATLATVMLLRPHLQRLLDEVCGTPARAGFWLATSLLAIAIIGVLAGTSTYGYPDAATASAQDVFLGGVTQLRLFLVGLLGSVLAIAWGLVQAIRAFERRADLHAYYAAIERGAPPAPGQRPPAAAPPRA